MSEKKPEPVDPLDDLIALIRTGEPANKVRPTPAPAKDHSVKETVTYQLPNGKTIVKPKPHVKLAPAISGMQLEVSEQEAVDANLPKDEMDKLYAAESAAALKQALLTPVEQGSYGSDGTIDWVKFNLPGKHAKYGFDSLVVYLTERGRECALLDEVKPLDVGTIWLHYNVVEATVSNKLDEPIWYYSIHDYDDFEEHKMEPHSVDGAAFFDMKHLIVTSAKAKRIKNFSFLAPWMPVEL